MTNPQVSPVKQEGHRDPNTKADTSEVVKALVFSCQQLDFDPDHWTDLLDAARSEFEQLTRDAVTTTDPNWGLTSKAFQCKMQELSIRLDVLEEFNNLLQSAAT